ncbi:Neopullulanase / Maltodextrin glucosidase [Alloactinosynnema sp. L-07]|uniref:pullulanase-type alpha-1,6-glucosidase n=1 Tax=Alloactinosynnema sp. L-07 TaxID=1653480 RepID=UPI00065F00A2|nr:pullulanase-type alpha-1,6-glucosidase [Alloactinosynnema sp. L-07]CRK57908.1 Neopullulanase / Maltodextrin glucosidase [Alloactinosynnema sp. L-07]
MGRRANAVLAVILGTALAVPLLPTITGAATAAEPAARLAIGEIVDIAPGVRSGDKKLAKDALRDDLSGERFYFVMPDRFANGDPRNDRGGSAETDRLKTGFDPADKGFYHGGDLPGLRSKLDYLKGMGITAIWMTPMFANQWVQGSGDDVSAGYHGYWTTDFTRLDPHFGTTDDMRAVIADAHAKGMKVFFDIVANHTADVIDYTEGKYDYLGTGAQPYLDAQGNVVDIKATAGKPDFPALAPASSFPYTPKFRSPADANAKTPDWLNDPALYHNRGNSTFSGESNEYGDFFGLDDLMTENPKVVDGMKRIFTTWIDTLGIDGYRVDTVKHVNMEFWQALAPHVKAYANARGKKDFFVFGEVFSSDTALTSSYTTTGRMQATLDFPFQSGALDFLSGKGSGRLAEVLLADDQYTDADSNAASLPTFLGNHDMGRMAWMLRQERPGITEDELLRRLKLGNTLMYLWRGNPVVYYGDEQGFAGSGGDKVARQDMFASRTPEYMAEKFVGSDRTGAQDNFVTSHPLYRQLANLARFVDRDPVWADGNQVLRLAEGDTLAFSRITRRDQREYVVVANAGPTPSTVDVPVGAPGRKFRTQLPSRGTAPTSGTDGKIKVSVPAFSAVVLSSTERLPVATPAPTLVAPAVGTVLDDRVEVRADGITSPFAQATFAARVEGTTEWTVLGTDDSAPYRVFADVSKLGGAAVGKKVEFRVVAKDGAGALGADGAAVTLVAAPPPPGGPGQSPDWLVVHYNRPAGDYAGWGLHVWGDVETPTEWSTPLPFAGETGYGRFAWVKLKPGATQVGFITHKGDEKDGGDRFAAPAATPQVWLKQGQDTQYPSEVAATGKATVHFQRPSGDYSGFAVRVPGQADVPLSGRAAFGAVAEIPATATPLDFAVVNGSSTVMTGKLTGAAAWVREGSPAVHASLAAAENRAVIHYSRPDGDYTDWVLYHWTGSLEPSPGWTQSRPADGSDGFGIHWSVPLAPGAAGLSNIIHKGDTKDPGSDQFLDVGGTGHEVWFISGSARPDGSANYVLPPSTAPAADIDLAKAKAIWVSRDRLIWDVPVVGTDGYHVRYDADGRITVVDGQVQGGKVLRLQPSGALSGDLATKFPHLAGKPTFQVRAADAGRIDEALRAQQAAVHVDASGAVRHATGIQIAGALDDRYGSEAAKHGYRPAFSGDQVSTRLWAPTARSVKLRLFGTTSPARDAQPSQVVDLRRDDVTGSWTGSGAWRDFYYQFEVTGWSAPENRFRTVVVTDPHSVALSVDSTHSQFADLGSDGAKPAGWDQQVARGLGGDATEHGITELHVRDFSIADDTVPEGERGTYRAFTHRDSVGMKHLKSLAEAGMDTVHLLPTFDIASIPERRADQQRPACDLASLPADSPQQQECTSAAAARDGFNWGYDPLHYDVPEGSYATDDAQSGPARARQYREMVQSLHDNGNRVVVDVVYNHTTASGDAANSVLDKVVPGYYQRLALDGTVANSTCCANTAPENAMMGKLVVDSVVHWARTYKVDGFRFDLMGHHPKANILAVRAALDALTVERDGVDGRAIRVYGEGWDFGEVAGNARFVQATQPTLEGTGIATFSDRQRDAMRGGGPFDEDPRVQGLASGLAGDLNGSPANGDPAARLVNYSDLVKLGMSGNLADFSFRSTAGPVVRGRDVSYNGSPAGYTASPGEVITYSDAHDNETLFDALALKLPVGTSMADRVRMQKIAHAPVLLGQGQPFMLAGSEFLRSKSLDRNSYDSGDWFNRYDPALRSNGFARGLPPAADNRAKWPYMGPVLATPSVSPATADMRRAVDDTLELLRIRQSSPLFTLADADAVQTKLSFPAAAAGLIVAHLDDTVGTDVDPGREGLLVVVNPFPTEKTVTVPASGWTTHPLSTDAGRAVVADGSVTVPARSVVVLSR